MFLAIARKLNLDYFCDMPLRPCGTSRYGTEIAEAFITVYSLRCCAVYVVCEKCDTVKLAVCDHKLARVLYSV